MFDTHTYVGLPSLVIDTLCRANPDHVQFHITWPVYNASTWYVVRLGTVVLGLLTAIEGLLLEIEAMPDSTGRNKTGILLNASVPIICI